MYPSTLTTFVNPTPSDKLNNPSHSSIESAQNNALTGLQTFVGTLSSVSGTILYDVRSPQSDGGGHVQTAAKGGTGQTTYTKGDLLVAQNTSTLTRLAIGVDGTTLKANSSVATGVEWGSGTTVPTVRIYSVAAASPTVSVISTWVKPSALSYIVVEMVGGGAGGGSLPAGTDANSGGGAAGGYARKIYSGATLSTASVIVGNAGPVSSVAGNSLFIPSNGISSVRATGGAPGDPSGSAITPGGVAGIATGGDVNLSGQNGGQGATVSAAFYISGKGGDSYFGYGGNSGVAIGATVAGANDGTGFGSGGSGNAKDTENNALVGGSGKPGTVIIYEY